VVAAPEKGKYGRGESVFVHHLVKDDAWSENFSTKEVLATVEENILFSGTSPEDCADRDVVVFKYLKKKEEKSESGIYTQVSYTDEYKGEVVAGGLPKGSIITYRENKELEIWHNEEQYLFMDLVNVTSVDGEPCGDWYEVNDFSDVYFDTGIVALKGQTALAKKYNIELRGRQKIAKLKNENLPYHGKMVLCQERWKDNYLNASPNYYKDQYNDFKGSMGVLFLLPDFE
jgi:co-chaperonin GroES (HSP10)